MDYLHQLEIIFDNFIQVSETRKALLDQLEKEKSANLLYYYEHVKRFIKNAQRGLKDDTVLTGSESTTNNNSSQGSANGNPATASSSILNKSSKNHKRDSLTQLPLNNTNFDLYYEVEIIVSDFLEPSGKHFIPHFDSLRNILVSKIRERKQIQKEDVDTEAEDAIFYVEAFHDFTNSVYTKLKYDIFPRLIRTDFVSNFFKNLSEQDRSTLLHKVCKKQQMDVHNILYTEKEFNDDLLCERDFMFTFQLIHDSSSIWTPIFHADESDDSRPSAFYSSQGFMANAKKDDEFIMLKYMGYLPYNVDDCAKILLNGDYVKKSENSIAKNEFIELHLPNKAEESHKSFLERRVASSINYVCIKMGAFLTKRDLVSNSSVRYFPHLEEYLQVAKPVYHHLCPERKNRIRAKVLSGLSFERIASNETRFTFLSYFQMGGWLKKFSKVLIKLAKFRCKTMVQTFSKMIEEALKKQKDWRDYLPEMMSATMAIPRVFEWNEENIDSKEVEEHYKTFSNKNLFDLKTKKEVKQLTVRF